jgi:hypothetical protein
VSNLVPGDPKEAGMAEMMNPPANQNPALAKKNKILAGYAAFNDGKREILEQVFCENLKDDNDVLEFPAWHLMDSTEVKRGQEEVIDYLLDTLRDGDQGARAEFLGVASHGNTSISVDYTYNGPGGDHACADKIVFDEASGRIKEVWHCSTDTHEPGP